MKTLCCYGVFSVVLVASCDPNAVFSQTLQLSATEKPPVLTVAQNEPSTASFGGRTPTGWISCYNDYTHANAQPPLRSFTTCSVWRPPSEGVQVISIVGEAPSFCNDPAPSGDPWVISDPSAPNRALLLSLMQWRTVTGVVRRSIGLTILEQDSVGVVRQLVPMRPITGSGIEGPPSSAEATETDISPDRPSIACEQDPDSQGNRRCYIVFKQFRKLRIMAPTGGVRIVNQSRIVVSWRDSASEIQQGWSLPMPIRLADADDPTDSEGWTNQPTRIPEERRIQHAPQIAVDRRTRSVAVAVSFFHPDLGREGNYFVGVSSGRSTVGWAAFPVTQSSVPNSLPVRQAHQDNSVFRHPWGIDNVLFRGNPVPALAFDEARGRWVLAFTSLLPGYVASSNPRENRQTARDALFVPSSPTGSAGSWSTPQQISNPAPLLSFEGRSIARDIIFPSITYDRSNERLTIGWQESVDTVDTNPSTSERFLDNSRWRPVLRQSRDGTTWGAPYELGTSSLDSKLERNGGPFPFVGDYTSVASRGGYVFYSWPAIRVTPSGDPLSETTDIFGAEVQFP